MDSPGRIAELEARLRAAEHRLEALREFNRALASTTTDLDRLPLLLLDKLCELLDAERATLFLLSESGEELRARIGEGGAVEEIRLKLGEGIAGWVARSGETLNIADAYADARFQKEVDQRSGFRTRSILCMPMPDHKGRIIGVLQVLNKRHHAFDRDDEMMLGAVASFSGIALENSRLYRSIISKNVALMNAQDELRRRVADLDLLLQIEREAAASTDLDDLLDRLLTRAMQLVGAEAGAVLLRERPTGEMYFRSAVGGSGDAMKRFKLPEGQGVVGWVALHKTPLVVNEPSSDARHDTSLADRVGFRPRNIVAVPLLHVNEDEEIESLGAIELLNHVGGSGFGQADEKMLMLIAGHASRALHLARAKEERGKQERLAAIGQLLAGVLHDMRTPMTVISGYAQIMVSTDDADTRARHSEAIQKQFELMSAMMREVLQFARGESQLLVRKVFVAKFVEEVRSQLGREMEGRGIRLVVETRYTGTAYFDEVKLYRAISNIARNAMQAMPDGGVFTITIDSKDDELLIDLADTGMGIPVELEGRMFQLFATSGKPGGTGLGLAIVKKIVDEHGGRVSYTSDAGKGTTFHVALPLRRELSGLIKLDMLAPGESPSGGGPARR